MPHIQPDARILALSWDGSTPAKAAEKLVSMGFGPSRLTVLERMGGGDEAMQFTTAEGFDLTDIAPLNVLAIEIVAGPLARPLPLASGLPDDFFERMTGQLTKREIRAGDAVRATAAASRASCLWDVGLGAGSIAIEWLLRHPANQAIGIEEDPGAGLGGP